VREREIQGSFTLVESIKFSAQFNTSSNECSENNLEH